MARGPDPRTADLSVRMPVEYHEAIRAHADARGWSWSDVVRAAVKRYLRLPAVRMRRPGQHRP